MSSKSDQACDGCSACCLSVGHPPFLLEGYGARCCRLVVKTPQPTFVALKAQPVAAQVAYLKHRGTINAACSWLDVAKKRCRYYEFRPDICRTFEVGGKWCSQFRELHQIG